MPKRRRHEPSAVIAGRLKIFRSKIQQKSLDSYLVTSPIDQFYLTDFAGEDGAALILPRRVCIVTDGRFREEAEDRAGWASLTVRSSGPLTEALSDLARRHRLRRIGFDPQQVTVELYRKLRRMLRPARLIATPGAVADLRLTKDPTEVARIQRAIDVAEGAFRAVLKRLRPGLTEREVAADLQHEMMRQGASGPSFEIIVAEGPQSSLPHARPGDRRLRVGSAVLIDWGATVDYYRSDLTRVVFIRRIPPRFRRMYENVQAAQEEGIKAIRPGVRMCDVDGKARARLKAAGMDKAFAHGLGHGLGLNIHEAPRLSATATDPLKPGMVVTVEPGVYYPGVGGVRIEDDVLVTPDGCRVLTHLPREADAMIV